MRANPGKRASAVPVFAGICSAGLVLAVTGTFLSWFRSGQVQRNSYQTVGIIDHLGLLNHPVAGVVLSWWVALPLLCAVCMGMFAAQLLRTAAFITGVLAIIVGTISVLALVQSTDEGGTFGVTMIGPATTTAGMAVSALAVPGVLVSARRARLQQNMGMGRTGSKS